MKIEEEPIDILPTKICCSCSEQIERAVNIRRTCITSNQILRNSVNSDDIKAKEEEIDEMPEALVSITEIMQTDEMVWIKNENEEWPDTPREEASNSSFDQLEPSREEEQQKVESKKVSNKSSRKICPVCGKIYTNWYLSIHMETHLDRERDSDRQLDDCSSKKSKKGRNTDQITKERKTARQSGKFYIDYNGAAHKERQVKQPCNANCHLKCSSRISADQRLEAHKQFWSLSDLQKVQFYNEHLVKKPVQRRRTLQPEKNREFTVRYHLTIDGQLLEVCRVMFIKTLDISVGRIYHFMKSKDGEAPVEYKQGRHRTRAIKEEDKEKICSHIRSIPTIQIGDEIYADGFPHLTSLYENYAKENEIQHMSYGTYRKIFLSEFKISFMNLKIARNL